MRVLVSVLAVAVVLAVGLLGSWWWVLAAGLGWAVWAVLSATLRSLVNQAPAGEGSAEPQPVAEGERSVYWCQECGTELLLLVRGSDSSPRHCGMKMQEHSGVSTN